jgi:Do/DeqQ family serine protease
MSLKGFFASRKAQVVYLGLAMTVGFGLALGVLALNGSWVPQKTVLAEEKPIVVPASLFETQNTFRAISKSVLPAVVEIKTEGPVAAQAQDQQQNPPFDFFFGPQSPNSPENPGTPGTPDQTDPKNKGKAPKAPKSAGLGSGVMVQRQGDKIFILTNNHVIDGADKIKVNLLDKREYTATLVGADPRRDLALISIVTKETDLVLARLGDSSELQVGDWVLAMGNPLGLEFSVTSGIVSALGRQGGPDDTVNINNYIQTDASINRGNSGGALVNLKGEVVGINTWIASPNGASVGLGFAIPINSTKKAIADFISQGSVKYGWLGASVADVTKDLAADLKLPNTKGSYIPHVFRGSPADKSGILPGDFVTAINGKPIEDTNRLVQTVGDLPAGQSAEFSLIRNGQVIKKSVLIEVRAKETDLKALKLWPGFVVTPVTQEIRDQLDLAPSLEGLIVARVEDKSTADIAGLKVSDVLKAVNGKAVKTVGDFYRALNDQGGETKLTFVREGVELSIGITR